MRSYVPLYVIAAFAALAMAVVAVEQHNVHAALASTPRVQAATVDKAENPDEGLTARKIPLAQGVLTIWPDKIDGKLVFIFDYFGHVTLAVVDERAPAYAFSSTPNTGMFTTGTDSSIACAQNGKIVPCTDDLVGHVEELPK